MLEGKRATGPEELSGPPGPQGRRHRICGGGYTAVIAEVGASLVSLTDADGRHLVLPTPAEDLRQGCSGAVLAPWPNRIRDGRYTFAGKNHQLPLTEPERGNAAHGLVLWERWWLDAQASSPERAVLRLDPAPQPGYPFSLVLTCEYAVDRQGLTWAVTARNTGVAPAPYAVAGHPYLMPPTAEGAGRPGAVDAWHLSVPARSYLPVDPERLLPKQVDSDTEPTAGTLWDLTAEEGVPLAGRVWDLALGDLRRNAEGTVTCRLSRTERDHQETTLLTCGPGIEWVQIYTDDQGEPTAGRRAVALEPMTAPADAFNSGRSLLVLDPGEEHQVWWRIAAE